jgi:reactive chlorine resistance protein C
MTMPALETNDRHEPGPDVPAGIAARRAPRIARLGRAVAFAGVILPLVLIGGMKFTSVEIEALKPLIGMTPWLAWMYPVFGEAGASYVLGVVELATAALLLASIRWPAAGVIGGALATLTFFITCSIMLVFPIWEPSLGFPALGPAGQFLIKDVALLGVAICILGDSLARLGKDAGR